MSSESTSSGWYHSLDNVESLLMRLTMRIPTATNGSSAIERGLDVRWQQKVFGPRELIRYSVRSEGSDTTALTGEATSLEREYAQFLQSHVGASAALDEMEQAAATGVALYTYTDRDIRCVSSAMRSALLAGYTPAANAASAPGRHAQRERPVATMLLVAAVAIDAERLRARDPETPMTEVILAVIRAYARPTMRGAANGVVPVLLEAKPGYSQPIVLDATLQLAAAAAGLTTGRSFAPGYYGGALALRSRPTTSDQSDLVVVEVHNFYTEGIRGEFWLQNVEEDADNAVDEGSSVDNSLASTLNLSAHGYRRAVDAAWTTPGFERYLAEMSDPAEALHAAERRNVAALRARASVRWDGLRVPTLLLQSANKPLSAANAFSYTAFIEIVAAAGFGDNHDVFVSWELQLPTGWSLQNEQLDRPITAGQSGTANIGADNSGDKLAESASRNVVSGITQLARPVMHPWTWGGSSSTTSIVSASADKVAKECGAPNGAGSVRSPFSDSVADSRGECRCGPFSDNRGASVTSTRCVCGCAIASQLSDTDSLPVAHLGAPFEVHLTWDATRCRSVSVCGAAPPALLLTVVSQDSWNRQRVVGYATLALPLSAGSADLAASCWAPVPPAGQAAEVDFFLGGAVRLRNAGDAGIPSNVAAAAAAITSDDGSRDCVSLSRLGLRTRTSGIVAVRCSVIVGITN